MKKTLHTLLIICFAAVSSVHAQHTKLLDFEGQTNGSSPHGSLISDGTFLYGMTYEGGANGYQSGSNGMGTVFKILPDGTGYTKLLDFDGFETGRLPYGSLVSDGAFLYGMTVGGGANNQGTLFKILPDGTGFAKLLDFESATFGSYPRGSLISVGTFLYGMTQQGGANGMGTIFKIRPDGTDFSILLDFAGETNGSFPDGDLISDGTFLYGMTRLGGANNLGTVFKILPDGTGYTKLLDFDGTNGSRPGGSLISDGTFLYGMTSDGGENYMGTVFKILPDGTGYTKLLDFDYITNGRFPSGSLISDGTFLYGMTGDGGVNASGTIFKILPDGTGYIKLFDFDQTAGATIGGTPYGSLILEGNFLYGMTREGGANSKGTIFKYDICPMADAPGNVNACDSYTLPGLTVGNYYTETNGGGIMLSAGETITSSQTLYVYIEDGACTDENSFEITINTTPINTVTVSGITLTADEAGAAYQWLDCDNGNALIDGETNQTFTPVANGNYAVEITRDGCTATSACTAVNTVGINEHTASSISIYPNPSTGKFSIVTAQLGKNYSITDYTGKVIAQGNINQTQTDIDLSNYAKGLYLIKIEGYVYKLIKQ
jgi:uncharacterized repeat protein (TIGR03803 family)